MSTIPEGHVGARVNLCDAVVLGTGDKVLIKAARHADRTAIDVNAASISSGLRLLSLSTLCQAPQQCLDPGA